MSSTSDQALLDDLESFEPEEVDATASARPIIEKADLEAVEPEPETEESEPEKLERIAAENELMTLDEFSEVMRFAFGMPGAWMPDLAELAIASNEEAYALEAFAATRRLLIRCKPLWMLLRKPEGWTGDMIAAGSFFALKARIVASVLKARRQEALATKQAETADKSLKAERRENVETVADRDGHELGAGPAS